MTTMTETFFSGISEKEENAKANRTDALADYWQLCRSVVHGVTTEPPEDLKDLLAAAEKTPEQFQRDVRTCEQRFQSAAFFGDCATGEDIQAACRQATLDEKHARTAVEAAVAALEKASRKKTLGYGYAPPAPVEERNALVAAVDNAKAAWATAKERNRKVSRHATVLAGNPYPWWRAAASDVERQLNHARLRRLAISRELDTREATLAAAKEKLEAAKQNHKRCRALNEGQQSQFSVQQAADAVAKLQKQLDAIAPRFDALEREHAELGEKMETLQPEHDRLQASRLDP